MEVHVVSKADNSHHASFALNASFDASKDPRVTSPIQARPLLFSLSSNNLSYARGGDLLHWWDAFPVPKEAPSPYNDVTAWGIVPAWGHGVVTRSTNSAIPQGTVFWGFWPTADMIVNLDLQPDESPGCWKETTQYRQKMMTIYNVYQETGKIFSDPLEPVIKQEESQEMAWETLFRPTWQSGYLISQHVFAPESTAVSAIHPFGKGEWSIDDSDLSSAVLISLSASGKTARSLAYNVLQRPASSGPLGFLQVTSSPSPISAVPKLLKSSIPAKVVSYSDTGEAMDWMSEVNPSKIVIVDFGARDNSLQKLIDFIKGSKSLADVKLTLLQVGSQQKVYTAEDRQAAAQEMSILGKIQFNASGVRDAATDAIGAEAFGETFQSAWKSWLLHSHNIMPDIKVVLGSGVKGKDGVEGGWTRLCHGQVEGQEGLVYVMSNLKVN